MDYSTPKDLEGSSSSQISQELDDVFGHWRRSGQMIARRLESVFVGDPVDGDDDSFRGRVRVASPRYGSGLFGGGTDLFLDAALFHFNAISAFETVIEINECHSVITKLYYRFG